MTRKTARTIRREPPTTRELLKLANDLDRMSRALVRLAVRVADAEHDSTALQRFLAHQSETP